MVVMSLKRPVLPKAVEVVQAASQACGGRLFTVKGANEVRLDCMGTLSSETVAAWLKAAAKG